MTRFYRVKASLLRQVGEHDLTNLMLRNPGAYGRILDESALLAGETEES